ANQVSAAVDGDMTLVIWFSYLNNTHWGVFGARIAGDGTVLDPNGFFIADVGRDPTAAAISRGEQGFQLLWPDSETSSRKLLTATVFRDGGGGVDTTFALADLSATNTLALPSLGFDGVHHYGVYTDRSEPAPGIRLVQFDEDGGVAGDGGELLSTPGAFTYPGAIQCAEGECVLVYSELVGNAYELRGLQLSSDGGRRSFGNSLVTQPDDELLPTATPGDGGWLLSWARYQGAPFGGLRAVSRVIDPNATIPDAGSDGGVVDGGFTDAGFTDGGFSDAGITDGGELPDGGAPGRLHLRVGCGCDGASDLSVFALLLAASAVGIARRRSKARRGAERPV
ncbi:MAG: hypothetical protein ACJ790_07495, partial [Myxococcaceae bacterium]